MFSKIFMTKPDTWEGFSSSGSPTYPFLRISPNKLGREINNFIRYFLIFNEGLWSSPCYLSHTKLFLCLFLKKYILIIIINNYFCNFIIVNKHFIYIYILVNGTIIWLTRKCIFSGDPKHIINICKLSSAYIDVVKGACI